MSKLQDNFLNNFNGITFTTNQAYEWYCGVKSNPQHLPHRSEVHKLIIDPLLHRKAIVKVSKGLYQVANSITVEQADGQEDDWDSYIQSKLKQKGGDI